MCNGGSALAANGDAAMAMLVTHISSRRRNDLNVL
jgi:ammonia channel protein AmtB